MPKECSMTTRPLPRAGLPVPESRGPHAAARGAVGADELPDVSPLAPNSDPWVSKVLQLHRTTVHDLYAVVQRRTGTDRALAEDVVQETWLRAIAAWSEGEWPDDPMAWLVTVALNLLRSEARRMQPQSIDAARLDALLDESSADDVWLAPESATLVRWGLARLPADRARLLESFHLDGRSIRSLADEHRTSVKAVERRLARARKRLRTTLEPYVDRQRGTSPPPPD